VAADLVTARPAAAELLDERLVPVKDRSSEVRPFSGASPLRPASETRVPYRLRWVSLLKAASSLTPASVTSVSAR
jgi:hypothetical protein